MRFRAEHHFLSPVDVVLERLADPEFHLQLELPDLALPELLDHNDDGEIAQLVLRYAYTGQIDPVARNLLDGRELTWRQKVHIDRSMMHGNLEFGAEADPGKLHGSADFTVSDDADGGSVRRLNAELVVRVPLIGGMAERRIVPGLQRRLDIEALALDGDTDAD